ncbi:MAG TPA: C25 family cysteine peptidase [Flavisolibacter sp.]|nr:C25 family cysteine peptidase [Flavisolibacter sp.]
MKKILFGLLLTWSFAAKAQVYNNEWIDYSKTYFKFKVGKTGLYRIPQSVLSAAGLGSVPAEHFQLWRNGSQVALYTSVPSGTLGSGDYIEFWGLMNDGEPDRAIYRDPAYQMNAKWSLQSDTAVFFLTVNPSPAANRRINAAANNVAGNTLPAEPYFMYKQGNYFRYRVIHDTVINGQTVKDTLLNHPMQAPPRPGKDEYISRINRGYAVQVGELLYSSSYDRGEGWSSNDIVSFATNGGPFYGRNSFIFKNLYVHPGGPAPSFKIGVSGNAVNSRRYTVHINRDSVIGNAVDFFGHRTDSTTFSLSTLNSVRDTITVTNIANIACLPLPVGCQTDRMVIHQYELTYPRQFNFGGARNFEFTLPASATGNYLEISNFSYGASVPVLYDLTNGRRYEADLSAAPLLKFALPPSGSARNLVLTSTEPSNTNQVNALQTRTFVNYALDAYQGDYMIISAQELMAGPNGTNPVDEYRGYRSSASGGGYNAKIYLVDQLIDQFGFGIKKNPIALRNFIRYARLTYTVKPKHVFLIGRGVNYIHFRTYEMEPDMDKLNFVPTFGWPASDVLLTAEPGSSYPEVPVGRLSAITPQEVTVYLKKVKEFEQAQKLSSPAVADKGWMKNIVHIVGASEASLESQLSTALDSYSVIIQDTLFGGRVSKFSKSTSSAVEQLSSTRIQNLFNEGINLITYFGHSSATTLEFNLDNPENYSNFGKYPMFFGLGCNAGNFFNYSPVRLLTKETLSEKYVLAPDRGTIGFVASTHFGIVHYLDVWASRAYKHIAYKSYGKSIGEIMQLTAADVFDYNSQEDFYARCNTEESALNGDPAIRLNFHEKADYVIEDPMVKVSPGFISVADNSFRIDANIMNIGKAPDSSVVVEVKRQYPNQSTVVVFRDTIPGVRYIDSIRLDLPIVAATDKGLNRITVTIDADNKVSELYENNNSITKDVVIYEDEARPVYPYNLSIVNTPSAKFLASTANPFSPSKEYRMEIDTTELFNSPFKVTRNLTSAGGIMEFDPGVSFTDSTVYYWRVGPVVASGEITWNKSSFIYLQGSDAGFNQSHLYQHLKSSVSDIKMDSASRLWKYGLRYHNLFIKHGTWTTSTSQEAGVSVAVNSVDYIRNSCWFQCVSFNVFDPVTFKPWRNITHSSGDPVGGLYGSASNNCFGGREYTFEFRWDSVSNRRRAMDFMQSTIPDGAYVVVRSFLLDPVTYPSFASMLRYADDWKADEQLYGPGQSLYHSLRNAGFSGIDSMYKPRQFVLVYKKNDPSFTPKWVVSEGTFDNVTLSADCFTPDTSGTIASPVLGPSAMWKELRWAGTPMEAAQGDNARVDVIGVQQNGTTDTLLRNINPTQPVVDLSSISASQYPYLQLQLHNGDTSHYTPYQLRYWRVTYQPVPEGAIAPNLAFELKNTTEVAEPTSLKVAFKNVGPVPFPDSIKVKLVVTDRNNVQHVLPVPKQKPLQVGDTVHIQVPIDNRPFVGANIMGIEVNPAYDQPEQYLFNNLALRPFTVKGDTLNPLLDVTFDNVHILNYDIVSAKPEILIKLKDEARWNLLDDPSVMNVKIRKLPTSDDPTGYTREYNFGTDTLQFIPAQQAPSTNNTASAVFKPHFTEDGKYELMVSGKDKSDNAAGQLEYRVTFEVINTPMISNVLNYPNPFTTSTAFVFTLTGTEVPQNIRIQVLTVTGKVVREITKAELGPLKIGRNITEFKWDGTDQYGQKLANGVYLYRVLTNLNGKSLDKYTSRDDNTDKYFNKGYGKMYLMR